MALHLILSSLAWTIIPTALRLDYVTINVTAASNKSASLVICKQSLSTLTHAVANWWPIGPLPAVLHHDQPVAETSAWQHTTLTTNIHAPGGIRTHDLSRRAATDLRLRPRGHWDWQLYLCIVGFFWSLHMGCKLNSTYPLSHMWQGGLNKLNGIELYWIESSWEESDFGKGEKLGFDHGSLEHSCQCWLQGLSRRTSQTEGWWDKVKCQLDINSVIYWSFFSSTCFGRIRPSSGTLDVKLQHKVFCTEFVDGWWSWELLCRSCVRFGWCRAQHLLAPELFF